MARTDRVEYAEDNPGTVRELWTYLLIFVGIAVFNTVFYAVRTHDYGKTVVVAVWVAGATLAIVRSIRQFVALQMDPHAETTRFVFNLLRTTPIWGLVPTLLLL
jgi:hypothetical protein